MKHLASLVLAVAAGLLVIAATAPALIGLSNALVPLVIVVTIAAVLLRLLFVHTRRF